MSYKHKEQTKYVSRPVDENGIAHYSDEENETWNILMDRQLKVVENRACDEYIKGIEILGMPRDRIPQCKEISAALYQATGWQLEPVAALIPFEKFFELLANRRFPAATFIRTREDLDYLQEPDIFHEIFGHCPLLTNPSYAEFTHIYGKLSLEANKEDRALLARLYWFTIEFGLIRKKVIICESMAVEFFLPSVKPFTAWKIQPCNANLSIHSKRCAPPIVLISCSPFTL